MSRASIRRSRVTLAMIDAIAMHSERASPLTMPWCGYGKLPQRQAVDQDPGRNHRLEGGLLRLAGEQVRLDLQLAKADGRVDPLDRAAHRELRRAQDVEGLDLGHGRPSRRSRGSVPAPPVPRTRRKVRSRSAGGELLGIVDPAGLGHGPAALEEFLRHEHGAPQPPAPPARPRPGLVHADQPPEARRSASGRTRGVGGVWPWVLGQPRAHRFHSVFSFGTGSGSSSSLPASDTTS